MPHDPNCKHNEGFTFHTGERYPGLWLCTRCCGFFLNFDPEHHSDGNQYKFPDGVAFTAEEVLDEQDQSERGG